MMELQLPGFPLSKVKMSDNYDYEFLLKNMNDLEGYIERLETKGLDMKGLKLILQVSRQHLVHYWSQLDSISMSATIAKRYESVPKDFNDFQQAKASNKKTNNC